MDKSSVDYTQNTASSPTMVGVNLIAMESASSAPHGVKRQRGFRRDVQTLDRKMVTGDQILEATLW